MCVMMHFVRYMNDDVLTAKKVKMRKYEKSDGNCIIHRTSRCLYNVNEGYVGIVRC